MLSNLVRFTYKEAVGWTKRGSFFSFFFSFCFPLLAISQKHRSAISPLHLSLLVLGDVPSGIPMHALPDPAPKGW